MSKILIVDDDAELRDQIKEHLTARRYTVITARDGEEGLDKVKADNPDLIVLDVMMPKMNGFEVCQALRGEETGSDAYLVKPFEPIALLSKIQSLLRGR